MGSFNYFKVTRHTGKVKTPLNKKLENVEWGEFSFNKLFKVVTVKNKLTKFALDSEGEIPVYSSESTNNGIIGYTKKEAEFVVTEDNPIYIIFGDHTKSFNIATDSFCVMDNVKVLTVNKICSIKVLLYIISSWKKCIPNMGYSRHWSLAKNILFHLPIIKNNKIDFEFMESLITEVEAEQIAQLETYLLASGLKDYTLTAEEKKVLEDFENEKIEWGEFTYKNIFNKIAQGRRLTKDNQISGTIPFVMAGTTNTGVVNYISNPVASFPKNSITIDIFGNTFYRNYNFGAGDDTGVYWNNEKNHQKETMLFLTTSMKKSIFRKFDFGKKLRSSQSLDFKMKLPIQDNQPNYKIMQTLISAIQKLVIKDVVLYTDKKLNITK